MTPPTPLSATVATACCVGIALWTHLSNGKVTAALAVAWATSRSSGGSRVSEDTAVGVFTVAAMAVVTLTLGEDQKVNTGMSQAPLTAAGHGLNVFGGSSPYVWMGYDPGRTFDRVPWENPVGLAALVVMTMLLVLATWTRWRDEHDLLIPLVLGLCLAPLLRTFGDEMIMQKALIVFGFATLVVLAAVSSELRSLRLGLVAAVICAMPAVRSAHELWDIIYQPTITCTESNLADISDGQDWRILGYLHYREDRDGYDWAANPRFYHAITQFLPRPYQQRLADKYHLPRPE